MRVHLRLRCPTSTLSCYPLRHLQPPVRFTRVVTTHRLDFGVWAPADGNATDSPLVVSTTDTRRETAEVEQPQQFHSECHAQLNFGHKPNGFDIWH